MIKSLPLVGGDKQGDIVETVKSSIYVLRVSWVKVCDRSILIFKFP